MGNRNFEKLGSIFIIIASILILLSQVSSSIVNNYQNDINQRLVSAIDTQIKVTDVRLAMNEHLLRYIISINPTINKTAEKLSQQVNYSFTKEDVLRDYFTPSTQLTYYFLEVANLNDMRTHWETESFEALLLTFEIKKNKMFIWGIIETISNLSAFIFLILGILCYNKSFKKSKEI